MIPHLISSNDSFINCNKYTTLVRDIEIWEGMGLWDRVIWETSVPYLRFAVNLKLLTKNAHLNSNKILLNRK